MTKLNLPALSSESGLLKYLKEIKKFPLLTEEEELTLAMQWHNDKDIKAAQKLVTSHLRLVAKLAQQYKSYGLPMIDIISEGNIGLMTAVKKFDPSKGYRLSTYALWWIKAMIQDYILKSWSMVKIGTSATHKKLFFNLKRIRSKLFQANNGQVPYNEAEIIAKELNVTKEDVVDMSNRFNDYGASLNDSISDDSEHELINLIPEPSENQEFIIMEDQEKQFRLAKFRDALSSLDLREQDIINERRLKEVPTTLDVLGKKYAISMERVRQIEERAIQKLKFSVAAYNV